MSHCLYRPLPYVALLPEASHKTTPLCFELCLISPFGHLDQNAQVTPGFILFLFPSAIFYWCSRIRTPDIRISSLLGYHCATAADFFFIFRCLFFTFCNVQSLILSSVARWLEKGQILKKVAKTVAKQKKKTKYLQQS